MKIFRIIIALPLIMAAGTKLISAAEDSAWTKTFNGKDLTGWTPYFQKSGLKNPDSSYKFTPEGYLNIDIHLKFSETGFGHLFYTKKKLSYYMVRAVYRFPTATYGVADWAQGWNMQNNGLMLHSQDPATMGGKDFPTSIEVQLLGMKNEQNGDQKSKGFKYATTANMCSPGTMVAYNGTADYTPHCTAAQYPDAWKNTEIPWEDKDGWSDITVRVLADSLVQHYIHGIKVFEYTKLREDNKTPLKEGYLSLQAEGTSTQFKSVEILELVGCMDKTKPAYRSYFVKNDAAACNVTSLAQRDLPTSYDLVREGNSLSVRGDRAKIMDIRRMDGSRVNGFSNFNPNLKVFEITMPGLYLVSLQNEQGVTTLKVPFF